MKLKNCKVEIISKNYRIINVVVDDLVQWKKFVLLGIYMLIKEEKRMIFRNNFMLWKSLLIYFGLLGDFKELYYGNNKRGNLRVIFDRIKRLN